MLSEISVGCLMYYLMNNCKSNCVITDLENNFFVFEQADNKSEIKNKSDIKKFIRVIADAADLDTTKLIDIFDEMNVVKDSDFKCIETVTLSSTTNQDSTSSGASLTQFGGSVTSGQLNLDTETGPNASLSNTSVSGQTAVSNISATESEDNIETTDSIIKQCEFNKITSNFIALSNNYINNYYLADENKVKDEIKNINKEITKIKNDSSITNNDKEIQKKEKKVEKIEKEEQLNNYKAFKKLFIDNIFSICLVLIQKIYKRKRHLLMNHAKVYFK